jgi:hypothetical protein
MVPIQAREAASRLPPARRSRKRALGHSPVRGVDISGGTTVVNLPSFGSDPSGASDPSLPDALPRSNSSRTLGVTIVATASSGGAFEPYKNLLHGENTPRISTLLLGTGGHGICREAVAGNPYGGINSPANRIRTELADGLPHAPPGGLLHARYRRQLERTCACSKPVPPT